MAFRRKDTVKEKLRTLIIADSITVYVGSCVYAITAGYATNASTLVGTALVGIVVDIQDRFGNSIWGSLATIGGATVGGSPDSGYVTTGSANNTTDKIKVLVDVSKDTIYTADVTGTVGTTLTSDIGGGLCDLSTSLLIDETTHTRTITNGGQFYNWGVDPDDSTNLLVTLNESAVYGPSKALA